MAVYRKRLRGFELFDKHVFRITQNNWRSKQHPYFFWVKYPDGVFTLQIMRFEYWRS
jgi:hypothetical protein